MLFEFKNEYQPSHIYPSLDFTSIKSKLIKYSREYIDYGSIFLIKTEATNITVNKNGKIVAYYNDENKVVDILREIENTFKYQVPDFSYDAEIQYNL